MSADELAGQVRRIVADVCALEPAQVTDEARLATFGVDSVRAIDILVAIEHELGVTISDQEAGALATVGDLIARVARGARG